MMMMMVVVESVQSEPEPPARIQARSTTVGRVSVDLQYGAGWMELGNTREEFGGRDEMEPTRANLIGLGMEEEEEEEQQQQQLAGWRSRRRCWCWCWNMVCFGV
jgi:hypothetical protein